MINKYHTCCFLEKMLDKTAAEACLLGQSTIDHTFKEELPSTEQGHRKVNVYVQSLQLRKSEAVHLSFKALLRLDSIFFWRLFLPPFSPQISHTNVGRNWNNGRISFLCWIRNLMSHNSPESSDTLSVFHFLAKNAAPALVKEETKYLNFSSVKISIRCCGVIIFYFLAAMYNLHY